MGRSGSRSRLVWLSIGVLLLAGFSLVQVRSARGGVDEPGMIAVSECRAASYYAPDKKDLCREEAIALKPYRIETIQDGRSLLRFPNHTKVTVYGKSVFKIDKYDVRRGLFATVVSGRIRYAHPGESFNADIISGKALRLAHVGTTFVFSVGPEPGARPGAETTSPGTADDRDADSVAEREDSCPTQAGLAHANRALNGCPAMVERVVLLPDEDGSVGTVAVERVRGGVLAVLDEPYASVGITAGGEVVKPAIRETDDTIAALSPQSVQTAGADDPNAWCTDLKYRHCCTTPNCDGRSCCWVRLGGDFCRTNTSWSIERCFRMDSTDHGGGGEGHGAHFRWTDSADLSAPSWRDLGCKTDSRGKLSCTGRPSRGNQPPVIDPQRTKPN